MKQSQILYCLFVLNSKSLNNEFLKKFVINYLGT